MTDDRADTPEERGSAADTAQRTPAAAGAPAQVRPGDPRRAAYPVGEADYWREAHGREPYYAAGRNFEDYSTAYELGWVSYNLYGGEFDTAERVLANDWLVRKGVSALSWDEARPAARAAWQRAHNAHSFATDGTAAPEQVLAVLDDLAQSARDGELGFREAAAHARAPELVALFERLAQHCADAAAQWQQCSATLGGQVDESGSVAGAAQRVWLQIRGLFGGASDESLLAGCERGQDDVVRHAREALNRNLPPELHAAVQCHFEQAQRQLDHVKSLRERGVGAPAERELAT
jgi:uncharacterized protein (TIGR02284 family)